MLTFDQICKSLEVEFKSILEEWGKHNFYFEHGIYSEWENYQDCFKDVVRFTTREVMDFVDEYCANIVKKDYDGVIDAIVKEFGIDTALYEFNDEQPVNYYEFNTIDEVKNSRDIGVVINTLYYILDNNVFDKLMNIYAHTVWEHFN